MASRRKFYVRASHACGLTAMCSKAQFYLSDVTVEFGSAHSVDQIHLEVSTLNRPMVQSCLRGRSATTPSPFCTADTRRTLEAGLLDSPLFPSQ